MATRAPVLRMSRKDVQGFVDSIDKGFWDFLESVPDAMVLSDCNGQIIWVNTNTERMFGYSKEDLIGREIEVLVPKQFRAVHRKERATYYADPCIRRMGVGRELSARAKDGVEFPVEISLSPIEIHGKALVWSAIRDISDRERFLGQLRQVMEQNQLVLGGYISVCSWCKRVRDEGAWLSLEKYVAAHSKAKFTHGICKDCLAGLDPAARAQGRANCKPR